MLKVVEASQPFTFHLGDHMMRCIERLRWLNRPRRDRSSLSRLMVIAAGTGTVKECERQHRQQPTSASNSRSNCWRRRAQSAQTFCSKYVITAKEYISRGGKQETTYGTGISPRVQRRSLFRSFVQMQIEDVSGAF